MQRDRGQPTMVVWYIPAPRIEEDIPFIIMIGQSTVME